VERVAFWVAGSGIELVFGWGCENPAEIVFKLCLDNFTGQGNH